MLAFISDEYANLKKSPNWKLLLQLLQSIPCIPTVIKKGAGLVLACGSQQSVCVMRLPADSYIFKVGLPDDLPLVNMPIVDTSKRASDKGNSPSRITFMGQFLSSPEPGNDISSTVSSSMSWSDDARVDLQLLSDLGCRKGPSVEYLLNHIDRNEKSPQLCDDDNKTIFVQFAENPDEMTPKDWASIRSRRGVLVAKRFVPSPRADVDSHHDDDIAGTFEIVTDLLPSQLVTSDALVKSMGTVRVPGVAVLDLSNKDDWGLSDRELRWVLGKMDVRERMLFDDLSRLLTAPVAKHNDPNSLHSRALKFFFSSFATYEEDYKRVKGNSTLAFLPCINPSRIESQAYSCGASVPQPQRRSIM